MALRHFASSITVLALFFSSSLTFAGKQARFSATTTSTTTLEPPHFSADLKHYLQLLQLRYSDPAATFPQPPSSPSLNQTPTDAPPQTFSHLDTLGITEERELLGGVEKLDFGGESTPIRIQLLGSLFQDFQTSNSRISLASPRTPPFEEIETSGVEIFAEEMFTYHGEVTQTEEKLLELIRQTYLQLRNLTTTSDRRNILSEGIQNLQSQLTDLNALAAFIEAETQGALIRGTRLAEKERNLYDHLTALSATLISTLTTPLDHPPGSAVPKPSEENRMDTVIKLKARILPLIRAKQEELKECLELQSQLVSSSSAVHSLNPQNSRVENSNSLSTERYHQEIQRFSNQRAPFSLENRALNGREIPRLQTEIDQISPGVTAYSTFVTELQAHHHSQQRSRWSTALRYGAAMVVGAWAGQTAGVVSQVTAWGYSWPRRMLTWALPSHLFSAAGAATGIAAHGVWDAGGWILSRYRDFRFALRSYGMGHGFTSNLVHHQQTLRLQQDELEDLENQLAGLRNRSKQNTLEMAKLEIEIRKLRKKIEYYSLANAPANPNSPEELPRELPEALEDGEFLFHIPTTSELTHYEQLHADYTRRFGQTETLRTALYSVSSGELTKLLKDTVELQGRVGPHSREVALYLISLTQAIELNQQASAQLEALKNQPQPSSLTPEGKKEHKAEKRLLQQRILEVQKTLRMHQDRLTRFTQLERQLIELQSIAEPVILHSQTLLAEREREIEGNEQAAALFLLNEFLQPVVQAVPAAAALGTAITNTVLQQQRYRY